MIGRILAVAFGLCIGLAASQVPEYAQQYRQRLGGAIDELRSVVARFDDTARAENVTREAALARLAGNADAVARGQADSVTRIVERLNRLQRQRDDFTRAGSFGRLLVLTQQADPMLARAAYLDFEPAWPATGEGLVSGGIGFLVGWLAILFGARTARRLSPGRWNRRRSGALRSA